MAKRRLAALVTLAGLVQLQMAGGCHLAEHSPFGHGRCSSGKARVCDGGMACDSGCARIADSPEPSLVESDTVPAPPVNDVEPSAPSDDFPALERVAPERDPITVDKPKVDPNEYSPVPSSDQPGRIRAVEAKPVEPADIDFGPTVPKVNDKPAAGEPAVAAVPKINAITALRNLGAVIKLDKNWDPFGDDESIETVVGIDLSTARIVDADLDRLAGMKNLRELDLSGTQITDAGLKKLQPITGLELLWLNGTKVTDAGLDNLSGMIGLKSLGLANTTISDAGLGRLSHMKDLEYLLLAQTRVSDAGMEHLRSLTHLKGLSLMGTQVTERGVKELREALPGCQIVLDPKQEQGAFPMFKTGPLARLPKIGATKEAVSLPIELQKLPATDDAGIAFSRSGAHDAAVKVSERDQVDALKVVLNDPRLLDAAGQFCVSQGRWDEAISILTVALAAAPNDVLLRHHLAVAYGRSGDIDSALPHFIKSVGEAEAHYNVGVILYESGKLAAAEEHLLEALRIKPELQVARDQLDDVRRERQISRTPAELNEKIQDRSIWR